MRHCEASNKGRTFAPDWCQCAIRVQRGLARALPGESPEPRTGITTTCSASLQSMNLSPVATRTGIPAPPGERVDLRPGEESIEVLPQPDRGQALGIQRRVIVVGGREVRRMDDERRLCDHDELLIPYAQCADRTTVCSSRSRTGRYVQAVNRSPAPWILRARAAERGAKRIDVTEHAGWGNASSVAARLDFSWIASLPGVYSPPRSMTTLFVTFATGDFARATTLKRQLAQRGHEGIFVAHEDIELGQDWRETLFHNLRVARALVLLWSQRSSTSRMVP